MSTCTTLAADITAAGTPMFGGVTGMYFYGDTVSTICQTEATDLTKICINGQAADALSTYANYGVGVGLQLSVGTGSAKVAWNATAEEVAFLSFKISGVSAAGMGRPVRIQMGQIDDPTITDPNANYSKNSFVYGGTSPKDIKKDPTEAVVIALADIKAPKWIFDTGHLVVGSGMPAMTGEGQLIDATKLDSLQFQVTTDPEKPGPYNFCISEVKWLKADKVTEVVVAPRTAPTTPAGTTTAPVGSTTGTSTAPDGSSTAPVGSGSSTAPAGSGTAPVTSGSSTAPAPSTSSSAAPADAEWDAAWTAMSTGCDGAGCHNAPITGKTPWSLSGGKDASKALIEAGKAKIGSEVAGNMMPPSTATALTADEKAAIAAWVAP